MTRTNRLLRVTILLLYGMLAAGCGQKGVLVLPDTPGELQSAEPEDAEATDEADDTETRDPG